MTTTKRTTLKDKTMNLISMTDYVLVKAKEYQLSDDCEFAYSVRKYANFLKQPLKLGMFIPCDENDVPLEVPDEMKHPDYIELDFEYLSKESQQYEKAKERVLFDGFEYKDGLIIMPNKQFLDKTKLKNLKVEHLLIENLKLTDSAIKQLNI